MATAEDTATTREQVHDPDDVDDENDDDETFRIG
ncbi:unnamed protein product, partial [Didymodactylos carnosus]